MSRKRGKGWDNKVSMENVATTEVTRWLVGKSLLNGGNKLSPDLQELLDFSGIRVTKIVTNNEHEPMVCLRGPESRLNAIAAVAKSKLAV